MKTYKNIVTLSLIALFAVMPTFSSAKERDENLRLGLGLDAKVQVKVENEEKDEEKSERSDRDDKDKKERPTKKCFKAFGHLIAKGFVKNHGAVGVDFWKDCFLPKGIAKKLGGHATSSATSTLDVTAPAIANVSVVSGATTAMVGWKISENATSTLYYGTNSPLSLTASSTLSLSSRILRKVNSVLVSDLRASTTYYFRIQATDKAGNTTTSAESSFTTR